MNVEIIEKPLSMSFQVPAPFQVYAISHTLPSEPHISFKAVYPNPIRNLTIARVIDNKITLAWVPPQESLYTGYVIR